MNSRIVYSTDHGRMCPGCGRPVAGCSCRKASAERKGDGNVRVGRETKGRGGKCVTLITGLLLNADELADLAKKLKQKCGCGGTVKDGVIEIQGDRRDKVVEELRNEGYNPKKIGS